MIFGAEFHHTFVESNINDDCYGVVHDRGNNGVHFIDDDDSGDVHIGVMLCIIMMNRANFFSVFSLTLLMTFSQNGLSPNNFILHLLCHILSSYA